MADNLLNIITSELESKEDARNLKKVPNEDVINWMQCNDIHTLGAVYVFLTTDVHYKRIDPPLEFNDYKEFIKKYFARCIVENPDSQWADSRYSAGWDLVNWFNSFWEDNTVSRNVLKEIKEWLAGIYIDGNEDVKECIINATLEHLFENKKIANYFVDWKKHPSLSDAYKKAMEWTENK